MPMIAPPVDVSPLSPLPAGAPEQIASPWPPELMTEQELIIYLRIPEVSKSRNYHNVIAHLHRMYNLPRIHICGRPLYPLEAVREWIRSHTTSGGKPMVYEMPKTRRMGGGPTRVVNQHRERR